MAKTNIKNIENVEGKYHLAFAEGKKIIENAKQDLRFSFFAFLLFAVCILIFVLITGFSIFYIGFLAIFLIFFLITVIYLCIQIRAGKKQCLNAVKNSKASDIIATQIDYRKTGRAIIRSMSSTIDEYDADEKFPGLIRKTKRKIKHIHLAGVINSFEKEEKKER